MPNAPETPSSCRGLAWTFKRLIKPNNVVAIHQKEAEKVNLIVFLMQFIFEIFLFLQVVFQLNVKKIIWDKVNIKTIVDKLAVSIPIFIFNSCETIKVVNV